MYTACEIAEYVVSKCYGDGQPVSNLQLQKIMYFIQKSYLKSTGSPAFHDVIEAWQFGPVVPTVYYHYCGYGAMYITENHCLNSITPVDKVKFDAVILTKRSVNPWDLVEETHKPGGAWAVTFKNGSGNRKIISLDLIKKES